MTFNIGDRVKILPASDTGTTHVFEGKCGTVVEPDNDDIEEVYDHLVAIDSRSGYNTGWVYFFEAELEHI